MADPRVIDFEGIDEAFATFKFDSSIVYDKTKVGGAAQVGLAVTLSDDGIVGLVADGEAVAGKLVQVEPDVCNVQIEGGMTLPAGTGATLTNNKKIVGALLIAAKGYIREAASGTAAELVLARGRIIDNSVTNAVKVIL